MDWWEVQRRGRVKVYRAERIRRKVARGKLIGESTVRPLGATAWQPLRDVPDLLRPPAAGCGPGGRVGGAGRAARLQGLLWHVGIYAGVCWFLHLPPVVWALWG